MTKTQQHRIVSAVLSAALVAVVGAVLLKRSPAQHKGATAGKGPAAKNRPAAKRGRVAKNENGVVLTPVDAAETPQVPREFRAAWVATVANLDWPSKPGLTVAQQKAQAIAILDRAVQLNLNALIWQVRPMADSFYPSKLEPWSHYLTGTSGKDPGYDPLAFVIEEAHKRGLELHAWFNPYRAGATAKTDYAPNHVVKAHPEFVLRYGTFYWLDPGNLKALEHTLAVIRDVLRRYDIDGVHFDDYFYPYKQKDAAGKAIDFPDTVSYNVYLKSGGMLTRYDWRRENVNVLVRRTYEMVKAEKPWVKFGISPFGIWKSGVPASVRGLDFYNDNFADTRLWLTNGWVDYFAPQLYWAIDAPQQSYPVLLQWWSEQNTMNRHLWPGHGAHRLGKTFTAQEIVDQVKVTRTQSGATGDIFFSAKQLVSNNGGINQQLRRQIYAQPALVPASPWLDAKAPAAPRVKASLDKSPSGPVLAIKWHSGDKEPVRHWVVQTRTGQKWNYQILAGRQTGLSIVAVAGRLPDAVVVSAVDRTGNQSAPVLAKIS